MSNDSMELWLDHYESNGQTVWCWKRGVYSSQEFPTEESALEAEANDELQMSRPDGRDALDDLLTRRNVEPPFDYWIVGGAFVLEPSVGGMQLGELPHYQLPEGANTLEMTQEEFDALVNDFYMREGYYPDT